MTGVAVKASSSTFVAGKDIATTFSTLCSAVSATATTFYTGCTSKIGDDEYVATIFYV